MFQWVKFALIIAWSELTGKSVVDFFGGTYAVAGNVVRRIR